MYGIFIQCHQLPVNTSVPPLAYSATSVTYSINTTPRIVRRSQWEAPRWTTERTTTTLEGRREHIATIAKVSCQANFTFVFAYFVGMKYDDLITLRSLCGFNAV